MTKPRISFAEAYATATLIRNHILLSAKACHLAGSLRRGAETVGDIDLVVLASSLDAVRLPKTVKKRSGGAKYRRYDTVTEEGNTIGVDIWLCESEQQLGAFLWYATGPAELNVWMRQRAKQRGLTLTQYGVALRTVAVKQPKANCRTEESVARLLEMPYLTPQERQIWREKVPAATGRQANNNTERNK